VFVRKKQFSVLGFQSLGLVIVSYDAANNIFFAAVAVAIAVEVHQHMELSVLGQQASKAHRLDCSKKKSILSVRFEIPVNEVQV